MRFDPVPSVIPNTRMWVAKVGRWSFVIMLEANQQVGEAWTGYTASWKDRSKDMRPKLPSFGGTQESNRIGGPWHSFSTAERACREKLLELRRQEH
jgi:hypothetical protein